MEAGRMVDWWIDINLSTTQNWRSQRHPEGIMPDLFGEDGVKPLRMMGNPNLVPSGNQPWQWMIPELAMEV